MADLSLISEAAWHEARRRAEVVRPLAECERRPRCLVQAAAGALGLSERQTYTLVRRCRKHALGRVGRGARDLERISDVGLARLSAGTGVAVERLREMNATAIMARVNERVQGWLLSEDGRGALEELQVTLGRMARRREAYATADAGCLARQCWHLYGA